MLGIETGEQHPVEVLKPDQEVYLNPSRKLGPKGTHPGVTLVITAMALAGCNNAVPVTPQEPSVQRFDSTASVTVAATDTRADIARRYGGEVIVWHPEAGFAILGLNKLTAQNNAQEPRPDVARLSNSTPNQNALAIPEAVSGSGWSAWAGGWSAWAGGWSAWAGGWSSWAGGITTPTTFGENIPSWQLINLQAGQMLTPKLGAGVKVAVIDTGIDLKHPAFIGHLAPKSEWKDFVDGDATPQEAGVVGNLGYGHGTGVAGIVLQVAPNATILPIRVLDAQGQGDLDKVVSAIDWAVQKGATVINLSLGSTQSQPSLEQELKYASSKQVIVVAATGNTGDENVTYPARFGLDLKAGWNVVGVGSVGTSGKKSVFSTYGIGVAVVAPGENLYTAAPGNRLSAWSGTSMAAPVVTGILALALGEHPTIDKTKLGVVLDLSGQLYKTNLANPDYRFKLGMGFPNAELFLKLAVP